MIEARRVLETRPAVKDRWIDLRADRCATPARVEVAPHDVLGPPDRMHVAQALGTRPAAAPSLDAGEEGLAIPTPPVREGLDGLAGGLLAQSMHVAAAVPGPSAAGVLRPADTPRPCDTASGRSGRCAVSKARAALERSRDPHPEGIKRISYDLDATKKIAVFLYCQYRLQKGATGRDTPWVTPSGSR